MKELLYSIVGGISWVHTKISSWNDAFEHTFTDKELHFLVIGILGLLLIFLIYPIFKKLARDGHVMVITWIYVFTLIIVLTFAIEIGQRITNTGSMEFADIVFGAAGFIAMFAVFAVIRSIFNAIYRYIQRKRGKGPKH